jgi:RNA polymerase sigma-70 factor (ECF subfamily)
MSATEERATASDEELVRRFHQTGALEALDELARRHARTVRNLAYHMVLNEADADDLAQEALVRAFGALPAFRHEARFSTWLYRIAMNVTRSFLATRARSPVEGVEPVPDAAGPAVQKPDHLALDRELEAEIAAALADLTPKLRAALVLTTLHGLGVAEAARIEGCGLPTLYWRIHQARKELRKRLARYLDA